MTATGLIPNAFQCYASFVKQGRTNQKWTSEKELVTSTPWITILTLQLHCFQSPAAIQPQPRANSLKACATGLICHSLSPSVGVLIPLSTGISWTISQTHTYLQHCFFILRPPNLGLSRQLVQTPQSSGTWQPEHCPQRLERRPFFTGGSCCALFLVTGLIGLIGGARGSASSEPAIDDLSIKTNF